MPPLIHATIAELRAQAWSRAFLLTLVLVLPCAALVMARTWAAQRKASVTPLEDTAFA